jgi:uncharacterized flavoprotein (TIGR03862 family)
MPNPNRSTASAAVAIGPGRAPQVAIVGGGPAGLMAAEALLDAGAGVDVYDAMPTLGRKFLLAGKGGLNLTHSEPMDAFISRYGSRSSDVARWLQVLGPQALREWAQSLGVTTFVGTSGRVFPSEMKAAPLLRAWLHWLRARGLRVHARHRWNGELERDMPTDAPDGGGWHLGFDAPTGRTQERCDAVVLALGGASWPQLGSDGAWWPVLASLGVALVPLRPANCGFDVGWSPWMVSHHAGAPIKPVRLMFDGDGGGRFDRPGEFVVTATGIEGSLVYAVAARLRDQIERAGSATIVLDLVPGMDEQTLATRLARGRGARSWTNHLREHAGVSGVKAALLRERLDAPVIGQMLAQAPAELARQLKAWPLTLRAPRPVAEAISTAGGVMLEGLDDGLMLRGLPGVFCAGEMLDWEAPTGGYLLTACMASGRVAGQGLAAWWQHRAALRATMAR